MKKKTFALLLSLVLVFGVIAGGTLAWLIDKTDPVTNTFTVGDINIDLDESKNLDLKIVPGKNITKDPKVTVEANSEACWLFVKVEESNWPDFKNGTARKVDYKMATGWTALDETNYPGVYYREVAATTSAVVYPVLLNNTVTVSDTLSKTEVNQITTNPTLTFTAYAVQKEATTTAAAAWALAIA